jgi:hypothetical protein
MRLLDRVAALNLSLVMAHQADAAYWKEWEMFGLPGGIQLFTLFNVAAFLLLLWLFSAVIARQRTGLQGSFLIAGLFRGSSCQYTRRSRSPVMQSFTCLSRSRSSSARLLSPFGRLS